MTAPALTDYDIAMAMEMQSEGLQLKFIAVAYSITVDSLKQAIQRAKKRGMYIHKHVREWAHDVPAAEKLLICQKEAKGEKQEVLALEHNVRQPTISRIVAGRYRKEFNRYYKGD